MTQYQMIRVKNAAMTCAATAVAGARTPHAEFRAGSRDVYPTHPAPPEHEKRLHHKYRILNSMLLITAVSRVVKYIRCYSTKLSPDRFHLANLIYLLIEQEA